MARARLLSPSFFTDERVVSVSVFARLLFAGLWTESDREGRIEDKPIVLKMRLFPVDPVDVAELIGELVQAELITRYQVAGRAYLLVPKFKEHQHVHPKEAPSKLPPPPATAQAPCMTKEPGLKPHGEGVNPSDVQALGSSGPSDVQDLHALGPSVGPAPVERLRPEDKNSLRWDDHAEAFVAWARTQWVTLNDPGPKVRDWARAFFAKHQPADPELIRVAFAKFLLWCHQSGKTVGWGLWLSDSVWEPRWAEVRADAQRRSA